MSVVESSTQQNEEHDREQPMSPQWLPELNEDGLHGDWDASNDPPVDYAEPESLTTLSPPGRTISESKKEDDKMVQDLIAKLRSGPKISTGSVPKVNSDTSEYMNSTVDYQTRPPINDYSESSLESSSSPPPISPKTQELKELVPRNFATVRVSDSKPPIPSPRRKTHS